MCEHPDLPNWAALLIAVFFAYALFSITKRKSDCNLWVVLERLSVILNKFFKSGEEIWFGKDLSVNTKDKAGKIKTIYLPSNIKDDKSVRLEYKGKNTKFVFKKKAKLTFRIHNLGIPSTDATLFVRRRLPNGSTKSLVEKEIKIYPYIGIYRVSCDIKPAFLGEQELIVFVWLAADNPIALCPKLIIPINVTK